MAKPYTFGELVTLSGLTKNEATTLIQKGVIRPDVRDTTGTGAHRAFGFLDIFEAGVAGKLHHQIPGGMPTHAVDNTLAAIRLETELSQLVPSSWGSFLDPATREPGARFWICLLSDGVARVLDQAAHNALVSDTTDVLVTMRLDPVLIELETATQDHATAAERENAWMKRDTVTEPPHVAIEAAMRREFENAGFSDQQVATVFRQLRQKLATLGPAQRTEATFKRYVEMVDAIVLITGPGPNYVKWRHDVETILRRRKKKQSRVDDQIIQILADRGATHAAREKEVR